MRLKELADMLNNHEVEMVDVLQWNIFAQGEEEGELLKDNTTGEILRYDEDNDYHWCEFMPTMAEWAEGLNNKTYHVADVQYIIETQMEYNVFDYAACSIDDNAVVSDSDSYLAYDSKNDMFYSKSY